MYHRNEKHTSVVIKSEIYKQVRSSAYTCARYDTVSNSTYTYTLAEEVAEAESTVPSPRLSLLLDGCSFL